MKNKKMLGNLILIFTALVWGTAFVAQRVGMDYIEPITFGAVRMALAAVAVWLVALIIDKLNAGKPTGRSAEEEKAYRKNTIVGGIWCGLFLTAGSSFQQMGMVYTTAGKAGFITALYMLIVPIISALVFKRKNSWLVWVAVIMGVFGMYLLSIKEGFKLSKGDALVLVCAFLFSGHILCCDYFVQKGNPIKISAMQFTVAAVVSAVIALLVEEPSIEKIKSATIPILYTGLISGGLGYTLQIVAQKFTDPTVASLIMSLESVFAVLAGALLLHERMTTRELIGCAIMFAAIVMVQIPLPEKNKEQPQ